MTSLKIGDASPQFEAKDNVGNTIGYLTIQVKSWYCFSIQKQVHQDVQRKLAT